MIKKNNSLTNRIIELQNIPQAGFIHYILCLFDGVIQKESVIEDVAIWYGFIQASFLMPADRYRLCPNPD